VNLRCRRPVTNRTCEIGKRQSAAGWRGYAHSVIQRRFVAKALLVVSVIAGVGVAVPAAATAGPSFGTPTQLPLPAADANSMQIDAVSAVGCWSPGNCSTVGSGPSEEDGNQGNANNPLEANTEVNGVWGDAVTIPTPLSTWVGASVSAIACPAAGDCLAVGSYQSISDASSTDVAVTTPMMVVETGGQWGLPTQVGPSSGTAASFGSVTCANEDTCIATGESIGTPIFSTGADDSLNAPAAGGPGGPIACPASSDDSVQCWGASAVLTKDDNGDQVATVSATPESAGVWGSQQDVYVDDEGVNGLGVTASSMTCIAVNECTLAGVTKADDGTVAAYQDSAFVVAQNSTGTWGAASGIGDPPNTALPQDDDSGYVTVSQVACADLGDCVVVGSYGTTGPGNVDRVLPFAAFGSGGGWSSGQQVPVPSNATANSYEYGQGVACFTGGCTIAGYYVEAYGVQPGFATDVSLAGAGSGAASETTVGCRAVGSSGTFYCSVTVSSPTPSDGAPSGTVTFLASPGGAVGTGSCILVTQSSTTSTCSVTDTPTAEQNTQNVKVTATYPDTGNLTGSSGSDTIPAVTVAVSSAPVHTYLAGSNDAVFTATLSRPSNLATSFAYATKDGSATSSAGDYKKAIGTTRIAAGAISQTVTVTCYPTLTLRTPGTFELALSNPSGARLALTPITATIHPDLVAGTVKQIRFLAGHQGKPVIFLRRWHSKRYTRLAVGAKVDVGDELTTVEGGPAAIEFLLGGKVKTIAGQSASDQDKKSSAADSGTTDHLIAHTLHLKRTTAKDRYPVQVTTTDGVLQSS
jgi:hypothetical protein